MGPSRIYRHLKSRIHRKSVRRRAVRTGLLVGNIALLTVMFFVVLQSSSKDHLSTPALLSQAVASDAPVNPLDQLSSTDIAVNIARLTSVPEAVAITNQADSKAAELTQTQTNASVVTKPQVVATATKSKADIQTYVVKDGDSLGSIASQFGVTSDSIRWSNGMNNNNVTVGQTLTVPPVTGIVYTVKDGDTAESLAAKYRADKDKITQFNDAEIGGLKPGQQIVIPDATIQVVLATTQVTRAGTAASSTGNSVGFAWGGASYGGNAYAHGYCTWYVANRITIPNNWGNANTWDNYAPASGWTKSRTPVAGAIFQTDRGYAGHVGIVEAVSEDGSQIKYSDMNGIAGWGRVGYSDWVSSSTYEWYIYR